MAFTANAEGIESANVCGYQQVNVPAGYYVFTPTFKNIGADQKFDIKTLKPILPAGAQVANNQKVSIFVLDAAGNYGASISWYGKKEMWTIDGVNAIADGEVMVGAGQGIAVWNTVKVNETTGAEVAKGGVTTPIHFLVSGEVDLECRNLVPAGYMLNGNSTPVSINLKNVTPRLPSGLAVANNQKVSVFKLDSAGNYEASISWYGKSGMWTKDGTNPISDEEGVLAPGCGFAVWNTAKINAATGAEVAKGGVATAIYLELPRPIER